VAQNGYPSSYHLLFVAQNAVKKPRPFTCSLWQLDPLHWLITCLFNHHEHVLSLVELYQTTPGSLDPLMDLEITTLIIVITRLLLYVIIEIKPLEAHFKDKGGSTMCQSKPARYIVMCCRPSQSLVNNLVMHKF